LILTNIYEIYNSCKSVFAKTVGVAPGGSSHAGAAESDPNDRGPITGHGSPSHPTASCPPGGCP